MRSRSIVALAAALGLLIVSVGQTVAPTPLAAERLMQSLTAAPAEPPAPISAPEVVALAAVWPVPRDTERTDGFGERAAVYDAHGGLVVGAQFHTGQDFAAAYGTQVVAVDDGVVTSAGSLGVYGQQIVIRHDGYETRYAHLAAGSITVAVGDAVVMGQTVGAVGSTGASTGPHLHFEVSVAGNPVDPLVWLLEQAG